MEEKMMRARECVLKCAKFGLRSGRDLDWVSLL